MFEIRNEITNKLIQLLMGLAVPPSSILGPKEKGKKGGVPPEDGSGKCPDPLA